jgi:hypothetical protein
MKRHRFKVDKTKERRCAVTTRVDRVPQAAQVEGPSSRRRMESKFPRLFGFAKFGPTVECRFSTDRRQSQKTHTTSSCIHIQGCQGGVAFRQLLQKQLFALGSESLAVLFDFKNLVQKKIIYLLP